MLRNGLANYRLKVWVNAILLVVARINLAAPKVLAF